MDMNTGIILPAAVIGSSIVISIGVSIDSSSTRIRASSIAGKSRGGVNVAKDAHDRDVRERGVIEKFVSVFDHCSVNMRDFNAQFWYNHLSLTSPLSIASSSSLLVLARRDSMWLGNGVLTAGAYSWGSTTSQVNLFGPVSTGIGGGGKYACSSNSRLVILLK